MKFFIASCVLLLASGIYAQDAGYANCLEKDSISCLQMTLFRQARSVFENPQIELVGGVSLTKPTDGRQGKSLDDNTIAIQTAPTVEARNEELSSYFINNAKSFFQERSLTFNFANTARSIARAIPDDIKTDIKELIVEGRTKKKRVIKKLLPIILGIGAKVALLAVGSIFGLFLLAKKALIVSVIAFGLAIVAGISSGIGKAAGAAGAGAGLLGGLGGLFGGAGGKSNIVGGSGGGYSAGGNGGWSSGSSGWDSHGAYSSPVAQSVAYSGYKQARR